MYGGTKTEMERLLKDAEKFSGVKYDINNLSDVYNAIHVIQEQMDVTNTTAEEAKKTISGSVNSMKAAFDNFLNGSGSAKDLAETVTNVLTNVSDAIVKLAPDILSGIVTLIEKLLPQVAKILIDLVPQLLDAVSSMIDSLLNMVTQDLSGLQNTLSLLVNKIVEFFTSNLPKILELGLQLIISLAKGIAESLPTLIPQIIDCILKIVDVLVENLDLIIDAGIQLTVGLIEGLTGPDALAKIIESIPMIIIKIIEAIVKSLPQIVEAGFTIVGSLVAGIISNTGAVKIGIAEVIAKIKNKMNELPTMAVKWGKDMLKGFIDGIKSMISKVSDAAKSVAERIKKILHFSRPDEGPLRDYNTWMPDMIKGLVTDIEKSSYLLENAVDKMAQKMANKMSFNDYLGNTTNAMKSLNYGVKNSLNPIVNPNANSLILEKQNQSAINNNEMGNFTAIINNNSKYTSPSENVRLARQEYEKYRLKYGGVR